MSAAPAQPLPTLIARPLTALGPADDELRRLQMEEHAALGGSSFGDIFRSMLETGPTGSLVWLSGQQGYTSDPKFELTQKRLDELTQGQDPDLWGVYANAVSDQHADYLRFQNEAVMDKRRTLANGVGFSSFSAQMLGSLADPGSVAVGLLTGGGATVARMGLAGRAAVNAAIMGGTGAGLTMLQRSVDPSVTSGDVARAAMGGAGFGTASGLAGTLGLVPRTLAGAAGQALPPLAVDLFDNRDRSAVLMDLGTNLAFGGLFNAIPGRQATPEQVRMAEGFHKVGQQMQTAAHGLPVDYAASIPAIEAIIQPETVRHPFPNELTPNVSGIPHSEESILAPSEIKPVRTQVFASESEARIAAQQLPNATVQNVLGTWTVLEGDRSFNRSANLRLTPADIVTDLGLRSTIEELSARGMTAQEIWGMIDGLGVAPRFDAETGRQFIDSARIDLRVPSRNKPEELAQWARAKGYSTNPISNEEIATLLGNLDNTIATELAKRNPKTQTGSLSLSSNDTQSASVRGTNTDAHLQVLADAPPTKTLGAATPATTVIDQNRYPIKDGTRVLDSTVSDGIMGQVKDALDRGATVTYESKRDGVKFDVAGVRPTGLVDPKGNPWGLIGVAQGDTITITEPASPQKTLGAATPADTAQPGVKPPTDPTDLDLSELARLQNTIPKAAYSQRIKVGGADIGLARWDMVGMVGGSDIPEFRTAARATGLDWLPDAEGNPITYSASEWVIDRHKAAMADAYLPADRAFYDYQKGGGKMSRDQFDIELGRALRRPEEPPTDPHIAAATKAYRAVLDAIHERAIRHGVDMGYNPGYVPRRYSPEAIDAIATELGRRLLPDRDEPTQFARGRQAVVDFLTEAIDRKNIDPKNAERADAIVQNGGRSTTEDPTAKRIDMDETHVADMKMPDGSTYRLAVEDMLENNAAVLLSSYSHRLHGKMAVSRLAEVLGTNMDGSKDVVEGIGGIVKRLEEIARDRGIPSAVYGSDLSKIERMLKLAAGVPVYDHTTGTRVLDAIRKVGMIRTMSNIGSAVNNQVELIHAMSELGAGNVLRRWVPAMREVINLARTGEQGPQLARDLERMGIAIDRVTSRILPRRGEELGHPIGKSAPEMWLTKAERFSFDVSLQSFTTDAARLATGMAFMDRWAELSHSGRSFSESRLAQMGLSTADSAAIMEQIRKHVVWVDGKPGGTLDHLGLEHWDAFTRRQFQQAASRTVRRLILENNPTSYAAWMTTPGGKVLAQLRTFAFGSHAAKFLAEVQQRDATTAYTIALTTIGAASLYTARTMMDAAVQGKDRKKFLADRLAPDKVMKAAYSRAAYSALFPTFIDTLYADIARQDPIFSFARTSGLNGGIALGNPTIDFLRETGILQGDPLRVPRAIVAPAFPGYRFSQQDYRALKAGLAIPDILNLRKLMDSYARELPSTSN